MRNYPIRQLISVSDKQKLEENGIPFKPSTLRKWHHLGNHSEIFVKAGGKLCIDITKFWEWIDDIKNEKYKKVEKYKKRLDKL